MIAIIWIHIAELFDLFCDWLFHEILNEPESPDILREAQSWMSSRIEIA